jgi:hypothetical protein
MFSSVLLLAVALLLLVVLVPIGVALFQRMRRVDEERRAMREEERRAIKDDGTLLAGTAKIPPLNPPAKPPAPAERSQPPEPPPQPSTGPPTGPPPQPAARPTRPVEKKKDTHEVAIADVPGSTMMMQWNGLLLCTSGPLEGQRFIIDDQGFYIGRDSTLSKVVIADSRISKRHVQIVPRNGKVWAVDQSSTNGTYLARARDERIKEVQLSRGDEIILADDAATFRYQV